ncbi:hypothetical protein [Pedomonas sp. V897]|uniref:hypothetical protein n=1 Tax=Pedomonas sp. V897 TaxID=3446482 RepID=UPI003EE016FA
MISSVSAPPTEQTPLAATLKLLAGIALTVLVLAPIQRVGGLPVSSFLLFSLLGVLVVQKIPRTPALIWAFSLLFVTLLSARTYVAAGGSIKDAAYSYIVFQQFVSFLFVWVILEHDGHDFIVRSLKAMLIGQLLLMAAQTVNFLNITDLLSPYWTWLATNVAADTNQALRFISGAESRRVPGTFGNATYAAMLCYFMARTIYLSDPRKRWLILGFVGLLLGGHRMGLLAFFLFEFIIRFLIGHSLAKGLLISFAGLCVFMLFLACMTWADSSKTYPNLVGWTINTFVIEKRLSWRDFESVFHRLNMIDWALKSPERLLIGGLSLTELPPKAYVDSEFVLRSLQFGLPGFLILLAPYLWPLTLRWDHRTVFLAFFITFLSITITVSTNPVCIPYTSIYLGLLLYNLNQKPTKADASGKLREND